MVRRDVAGAKIARAQAWLNDSEARLECPPETFVSEVERRDLAIFYLFLAIQECVDLAAHWVADAGWTPADDAASTFDVLAERKVISRELSDLMRAAVGLRNRIGHGYASLDYVRIQTEARQGLSGLRRFLAAAADAAGL